LVDGKGRIRKRITGHPCLVMLRFLLGFRVRWKVNYDSANSRNRSLEKERGEGNMAAGLQKEMR